MLSLGCKRVCYDGVKDADEEAFEDNAEEYMRRDVEGSGVQTTLLRLYLLCIRQQLTTVTNHM